MSYREYARHRNCSLRAVQKAVGEPGPDGQRTGRIGAALTPVPGSKSSKIDSHQADVLWQLNTDEVKRSTLFTPSDASQPSALQQDSTSARVTKANPGSQPRVENQSHLPNPEDDLDIPPGDPVAEATKKSYHESRALRAKIDAENAQLDLDERKGTLLPLEEHKRLAFTALRTLRDNLRNIAPRIAATLAASTDPFVCEQLLSTEIDAALASVTTETLLTDTDDDLEDDAPPQEGT